MITRIMRLGGIDCMEAQGLPSLFLRSPCMTAPQYPIPIMQVPAVVALLLTYCSGSA